MNEPLMMLRNVTVAFGGVRAIDGLTFNVAAGEFLSLIGPNGAGKTTVLNCISGFVRARGSILYRGRNLLREPAHRRATLGVGRTFQNLQLFGSMTLLDNVMTGQHVLIGGNVLLDILRFPVVNRERQARARALEILRMLDIDRYSGRRAETLPFGIQKLGGVARALALNPDVLLLDEPAAGLNTQETADLGAMVVKLQRELGLTVLLVEHNMRLVMKVSDRIVVMDGGRKLMEGEPSEVINCPEVIAAYLGRVSDPRTVEEIRSGLS
ncbi:MAG: ABC transporter ATP-binding protein [Chloroflexota bacterium]